MKSYNKYIFTLIAILFSVNAKTYFNNNSFSFDVSHSINSEKIYDSKFSKKTNHKSLKILTWNIQDLGRTKDNDEIIQIAQIIRNYDIVAIQEVVAIDPKGAQAVAKIWDELNRMGSKWDYRISNPTRSPSNNMSERYAYLWKTSKVSLLNRAYLDEGIQSQCVREPYIGKFLLKESQDTFHLINFHARVSNQNPELEIALFIDYPKRLNSENIIIMGDFNLDENHNVWKPFYQKGYSSAVENNPTTLKRACKDGVYLNHSIDNIYYNSNNFELINSGVIDFIKKCENLELARGLSDHLPVFLEFKFYK